MRLLFKAVGFASQKTLFSSELWSDQYWTVLKEDEAPDRSSVINIAKKNKKTLIQLNVEVQGGRSSLLAAS